MANVLVIDDERSIRQTLSVFLADAGHAVRAAADAEEALRLFAAEPAEVVVSDILMPGLKGTDLLERFVDEAPATVVILITGQASLDTAQAALRGGAFDYLLKPVTKETLVDVVARAARLAEAQRGHRLLSREHDEAVARLERLAGERGHRLLALSRRLYEAGRGERAAAAAGLEEAVSTCLARLRGHLTALPAERLAPAALASRDELLAGIGIALAKTKRFTAELDPERAGPPDPEAELRLLVERLRATAGLEVALAVEGLDALDAGAATVLLHVVREAVSNAVHHGGATRIEIAATADGKAWSALVTDNGRGFDAAALHAGRGGVGLLLMEQRVEEVAGSLEVRSRLGEGTSVALAVAG